MHAGLTSLVQVRDSADDVRVRIADYAMDMMAKGLILLPNNSQLSRDAGIHIITDHKTRVPQCWEAWPGWTSPAACHGGEQRKGRVRRRYAQEDKEGILNKRNLPADLGLLVAWCLVGLSQRPNRCRWILQAQTVLRLRPSEVEGLCQNKYTRKRMCESRLMIFVMKRMTERLNCVMNGLCPQEPGIIAPVGVVLCKQPEKILELTQWVLWSAQPKPAHEDDRLEGRPDVTCTGPARGPKPRMSQKRQVRCRSWMSAGVCACVIDKQDSASCHSPSVPKPSLKFERRVISSNHRFDCHPNFDTAKLKAALKARNSLR